jgi:hypothetical protein
MAYGEDLTLEVPKGTDTAFLGICLATDFEQAEWLVITAPTLEELKVEMRSNGYNLEHSQILRIKLPDISQLKRSEDSIKIVDMEIAPPQVN